MCRPCPRPSLPPKPSRFWVRLQPPRKPELNRSGRRCDEGHDRFYHPTLRALPHGTLLSSPTEGVEAFLASSAFDFGPAGLTFAKPVTVTLPYDPRIGSKAIDPERVAIAYYKGEPWALAGGTADPATRSVSIQLKEFEGSLLAVAIGTGVVLLLHAGIKWYWGSEGVRSDPAPSKTVKNLVTPKDPVIKQ